MKKANRIRKRAGKSGYAYCSGCDRALVADGKKCSVCGKRHHPRRGNPRKEPLP